ncbi:MAG: GTP-binding protein [Chloroflexi bacterium]|nr:GTP-binding protein [Chloroflexota bacterium]
MVALSDRAMEHLSIVVVGHVDHGKSTLLGRLYADTGSLPDGRIEKVQAICQQQGKEFEFAFLFDTFLEEQEQGITIDTARTFFSWDSREYVIIDAPGHKEFLKNMVSGAARAEAALLVIDAQEGVQEQSRKHAHLLAMLGVRQVAVVVNKMDLVAYRQEIFASIEDEYRAFLTKLGVTPERFIPVSAKLGDNVVSRSARTPWYTGPSVLEALGLFQKEIPQEDQPLRFPVQDVYKFDSRRILAGRIAAGRIRVGDRLVFAPSNKTARVKTIEGFNVDSPLLEGAARQSIGVTLDEQIFVERGEVACQEEFAPQVSTTLRCNVFWLGARPLEIGCRYLVRLATREVACEVVAIHHVIDVSELDVQETRTLLLKNEVGELTIRTKAPVAVDRSSDFEATGRFVLVDQCDVSGGGIVTEVLLDEHASLREEARRRDLSWVAGDVGPEARAAHYGHRAALVLLTGAAPNAQSALARRLEDHLVADGRHTYLLAPENLWRGLDADLLSADDRELVRRFGEVTRLLIDTGMIVVSPTSAFRRFDPDAVRTLLHPATVFMVHMGEPEANPDADVVLEASDDPNAAATNLIEELKRRGLLAYTLGEKRFEYASYTI